MPSKRPPEETEKELKESSKQYKGAAGVAVAAEIGDASEKDGRPYKKKIWSTEDEITFLKGMISFKKEGKKIQENWDEFLDFIEGKLQFEVTRQQIQNKLRCLRIKYNDNADKEKKGDTNQNFNNVLDEKAYQLSKQIWGGGANDDKDERGDGKKGKSQNATNGDDLDDYPCLTILANGHGTGFSKMQIFMEGLSKKGMMRLDAEKRKDFEGRWRKLFDVKADIFFDEIQLVRQMTEAVGDAKRDVQ